jgi:uncharacterized SAM-binding protein YcdF (DUF218 family)
MMFFILSKVLFFLLSPVTWMEILLILILFSKNPKLKRKLTQGIIIIGVLFSNPFLYRTAIMHWQTSPVNFTIQKIYDAGILLGGFSEYDKNNRGYFNNSADRFIQATNLYHQGIIKKIIMTGGNGSLSQDVPSETIFVTDQLLKNGVPKEDIILEPNSRNTYENAIFTKRIIDSLKLKGPFVLITSAEHMPRSEKTFRHAGIMVQPYPCNYYEFEERAELENTIAPDLKILVNWKYFLKEIIGTLTYQITGKA